MSTLRDDPYMAMLNELSFVGKWMSWVSNYGQQDDDIVSSTIYLLQQRGRSKAGGGAVEYVLSW